MDSAPSTRVFTDAAAGLGNYAGAAAVQPLVRRVLDFIFAALPPFATDFLGGKLAPP